MNIFLLNIFVILLSLCLQSAVFVASASESNNGLTEQKIIAFMKAQDDAFIRGDVAAMISTLADNYTSTSERPGQKVSKMTRGEVEANLVKNFPLFSNRQISHEDRKINISQDGQSGSVTAKNFVKLTVGDKNLNIVSLATDTLELRGGKIVVTSSVESIL